MEKINTTVLNKYNSYTETQLAKEFLTNTRNGDNMITARYFVQKAMGNFLNNTTEDGTIFLYSRVKMSSLLLQSIYELYKDNFQYSNYALNLEALTKVLEAFVASNSSRLINEEELQNVFVNFFTPLLRKAYNYRNAHEVIL